MGQISIVLIAGLVFLFFFEPSRGAGEFNQLLTLIVTGTIIILPPALVYFLGSYATRPLPIDQDARLRRLYLIKRSAIVFECLLLIGYICDVYLFNLPLLMSKVLDWTPLIYTQRLVGIVPLIVGLMLIRFALYEVEQQATSRNWKRREYLSVYLKFLLLPVLPLFVYLCLLDLIAHIPYLASNAYLPIALMASLIFLAYIYAPLILGFIWRTVPLADVNLRNRLHRLAAQDNIKYKDIVVWQTESVANAAVAGIVPWSRQIFLTEALLQHFSDDEIEAIVAHEFGHVRYKHILTYLMFLIVYFLSYTIYYIYIGQPLESLFSTSSLLPATVLVFFISLYFIIIFRALSRRFEHQADLYAVAVTAKPEALELALVRLAYLNYIPRSVQRLFELFQTHPSIDRRIKFIERFKGGDPAALRYQNYLLEVKLLLVLLPALACILLFSNSLELG
ncbi:M48 family metalloprotease [Candidatus Poribacteria bacterium]|nr:M48 family metalloprotease [Candidatus Poribacteria bacterium]